MCSECWTNEDERNYQKDMSMTHLRAAGGTVCGQEYRDETPWIVSTNIHEVDCILCAVACRHCGANVSRGLEHELGLEAGECSHGISHVECMVSVGCEVA